MTTLEHNKETISRLKFISKITINGKINERYMSIQDDSYVTSLLRLIYNDNRGKTLAFVSDTITRSFELLKFYENSSKKSELIMCDNIIVDLRESRNGLNALKETYNSDTKFKCDIDTLLQMIESRLEEINGLLPPPPETSLT